MVCAGRPRFLVLFVFAIVGLQSDGTFLAPPASKEAPGSSETSETFTGNSGTQGKALGFYNSSTCCTSRIECAQRSLHELTEGGRLVLPMPAIRGTQPGTSKPLQQLWSTLPEGTVVANASELSTEVEQCQEKTREGEEAGSRYSREGEEGRRDFAAVWIRRSHNSDCNSLGGNHSYSYGSSSVTPDGTTTERNHSGSRGEDGEDGRVGQSGDAQEGADGQGDNRRGCDGTACRVRESLKGGSTAAYVDSQNHQPAAKDGEATPSLADADRGARCEMDCMESAHEDEVCGARRTLQGETDSSTGSLQGAQGTVEGPSTRSSKSSPLDHGNQGGRADPECHGDPSLRVGRLVHGSATCLQLRGREGQGEDPAEGNSLIPGQATRQTGLRRATISFSEQVEVGFYGDDDSRENVNFSIHMEDLVDWDSKPWALHGGLFMEKAQRNLLRIATPLVPASFPIRPEDHGHEEVRTSSGEEADQGESGAHGDLQHHGGAHGEGDTGAQHDGRVLVHPRSSREDRAAALHTFGVKGGYMGRRSQRVSLEVLEDEGKLQELARSMWRGEIEDDVRFFFPTPQPQPMDPVHRPQRFMLVDLLHQDDPMHEGRTPVLCDIYAWVAGQRSRKTIAMMSPDPVTWHGLVHELALDRVCRDRVGNQCIIRVGWELRLNDAPHRMTPDNLITINYDQPASEGDLVELDGGYSLLQLQARVKTCGDGEQETDVASGSRDGTSSPTVSGRRDSAAEEVARSFRDIQRLRQLPDSDGHEDIASWTYFMYKRTNGYQRALLDPKDPFEERQQIAHVWSISPADLIGVHPVRARPEDLRQPGSIVNLIRTTEDAETRAFPSDPLVLFDIELHSGQLTDGRPKLFRHVDWTRSRMTREGLLAALRVNDFCRIVVHNRCLVWLNNVLWPHQLNEEKQLRMGDYVRIAVPAPNGQSLDAARRFLHITEEQARDHIVFEPSEEQSESADFEEQEESGSTHYGAPSSASEPEPHASVSLVEVHKFHALVDVCNSVGKGPIDCVLHCLCGPYTWTAHLRQQRPLHVDQIQKEINCHWNGLRGSEIFIHTISPQPWSTHTFAVHLIAEFLPGKVSVLRHLARPRLLQEVSYGEQGLKVRHQAQYVEIAEEEADFKELHCIYGRLQHGFESSHWSHAQQQFEAIDRFRLEAASRIVTLHFYGIDGGGFPKGVATCHVPIEQTADPAFLLQKGQEKWPIVGNWHFDFVYGNAAAGDLHFAVSESRTIDGGKVWFVEIHVWLQEKLTENYNIAIYTNKYIDDDSIQEIYGMLGLNCVFEVTDEDKEKPYACYGDSLHIHRRARRNGHSEAEIIDPPPFAELKKSYNLRPMNGDPGHLPRGTPISLTMSAQGQDYNPWRAATARQNEGVDFDEVLQLWAWLDAALPEVQWALPPHIEWNASAFPWTDLDWWDLCQADEIHIYTDGSASKEGCAASAVFFVKQNEEWKFGGFLCHELQGQPCAHRAELQGLMGGLHWLNSTLRRLSYFQQDFPKITFAFDATSAGYKAFGRWGGARYTDIVANLRAIIYFIEARFGIHINYEHVRGHSGNPGNEAADTVARHWQQLPSRRTSTWVAFFDVNAPWEVQWLWALWKYEWKDLWKDGRLLLPTKPKTFPTAQVMEAIAPPEARPTPEDTTGATATMECTFATANVLSLLTSTSSTKAQGIQGRARLEALQRSFHSAQAHIVGIQETRMRKECKIDQELYFVLSSVATQKGHYGVQLWFSKKLMLGTGPNGGHYFRKEHFKIIDRNPRCLIVKVMAPFMRAIVISAHCPTSQASPEEITDWWQRLRRSIPQRYEAWPHMLAIDANGRVGDLTSGSIGDHDADAQDHGGAELHDFLQEKQIWLPATYSRHHEGSSGTWAHPKTGHWTRGDFVGIPLTWRYQACLSRIMDVDLSLCREDHRAPGVTFSWTTTSRSEELRTHTTMLDNERLCSDLAGGKREATLHTLSGHIPILSWDADVHSHTYTLQTSLQRWTQRLYMKGPRQPMRKHLSEVTWALIQEKKAQRNFMHHSNQARRLQIMLACFQSWAKQEVEVGVEECPDTSRAFAVALRSFRALGRKVTASLRQDDRKFFDALAEETGEMDAQNQSKQLWDRIRWSLPKTKTKGLRSPLMMDCLDDQWIPHFARLEAGSTTTGPDLLRQCASRQACSHAVAEDPTASLRDLPTRYAVEKALRALQPNRAPGPDAISSTLLKGASATLSAPIHDLFCKMIWWTSEPVQFKGGHLHPIFKRGNEHDAACYRGIMLLSSISKVFHALMRKDLIQEIGEVKLDSQIGGFGGQQAVFGSHVIQTIAKLSSRVGVYS